MNQSINAIKFYEYEDEDDFEYNKILYIPKYKIYVYYESNKFIVYTLEYEFNQENYYNVEHIMIPETFADKMFDIYNMENEIKIIIKIISNNNKIYFDDF